MESSCSFWVLAVLCNIIKHTRIRLIEPQYQTNDTEATTTEATATDSTADSTTDAAEASSLVHALDQIDIYSNSWGPDEGQYFTGPGPLTQRSLSLGIKEGRNGLGAIYVWAAGNGEAYDNCNADGYVNSIYTIAITSMRYDGLPTWYSEYCAPAMAALYGGDVDQGIISTDFGNTCTYGWQGTSFSTPQAAGIIALALQANPLLTWRDVQHLIARTSNATTAYTGWTTNGAGLQVSDMLGFGFMDANAMVTESLTWENVPEQKYCTLPSQSPDLFITPQSSVHVYETVFCSQVQYLEHVLVTIVYSTFSRGHTAFTLTSPSGTESKLLTERPQEQYWEIDFEWTYMSVQFWGEQPNGTWKLTVFQGGTFLDRLDGDYTGLLVQWQLTFYGTETDPSNGFYNYTGSGTDGGTPGTSTDTTTTTTTPDSRKTTTSGRKATTDKTDIENMSIPILVACVVALCNVVLVFIVIILLLRKRSCQKSHLAELPDSRSGPITNIS